MSWQTVDIDVCADCRYAIAYSAGEVHDANDGWCEAFVAGVERETEGGVWDLVSGGGESDELGFSWSDCDVCRLRLGGDRFRAHLMRRRG